MKLFLRLASSVTKRFFWRKDLMNAISQVEKAKNELTTLEMLIAFPLIFRGQGYFKSLDLKQNMFELLGFVNELNKYKPKIVCEIGTFRGGTLFVWCQVADSNAHIISIDLPGGKFGGGYTERSLPLFQSFRSSGQTLDCLRGDSHSPKVKSDLLKLLDGKKIDFLFIDGDHSYSGVNRDFEDYFPLVRSGGVVGFHDIVCRPNNPDIEVWKFWDEIKNKFKFLEFVDSANKRRPIGIGLIVKE